MSNSRMVQLEESKTWGSLIIGQLRSRADEKFGGLADFRTPTFRLRLQADE